MTLTGSPWWARLLAVSTAVLALGWLTAGPAQAHASLVSTDPADGEVVATSPEAITLTFTEPVRLTDAITLLDADGTPVEVEVTGRDTVVTLTPAEPLADGTWIVGWRVISADTHPIAGGFSFSVGAPSATSVAVPTADAPRDVDLVRKGAEALRYAGVLLTTGLVFFSLAVAPAALRRSGVARRRVTRLGITGGLAAVLGALLLVPLTHAWQAGQRLGGLGSAAVDPDAWRTSTAAAAAVLTGALLLAAATVRRAPAVAWTAATVAVGSLALVGHTRTSGPAWLVLGADLAHVLVAAIWAGGLVGLLALLAGRPGVRPDDLRAAITRFSTVALVSVGVLAVSGAVLWWRVPATITGLPDTSYGWHLIVKVALVAVVVVLGAFNLWHLRSARRLDAARIHRTVRIEALVLALVVAVTAGMITQTPRAPEAASAAPATVTQEIELDGGLTATLTFTPGRVGTNAASVVVRDADGQPVEAIDPPELSVGIDEFDLGPFTHPLNAVAPGRYEANIDIPIEGEWTVRLAVRTSRFERPSGSTVWEVS